MPLHHLWLLTLVLAFFFGCVLQPPLRRSRINLDTPHHLLLMAELFGVLGMAIPFTLKYWGALRRIDATRVGVAVMDWWLGYHHISGWGNTSML